MSTVENKRIAKNTLLLYARMLFTMGLSLYISRIVLAALGVNDYGIYNVVGGFVSMFSIISASLAAGISRFITYELGHGNIEQLKKVFATSCFVQYAIGGVLIILAETFGLWFLNTHMNIAQTKMVAANWVFQCSVLTLFVNLISVPYNAAIVAHEKMSAFAYISIFEAVLKLIIAFTITLIPNYKLRIYAVLMMITALLVRILYTVYCKRHFEESRVYPKCHQELFKEIASFSSWNFIGASSSILRDQGINILINLFCGTATNAARGIAMQISGAVASFSSNFVTALNPQITKSFAQKDYSASFSLVFRGARIAYFILFIPALPVIIKIKDILSIWLTQVPDYTAIFAQLAVVSILIEIISYPLITLMLATGNIRNYQLLVGGIQLLNLPVSYVCLKLGYPPQSTFIVAIIINCITLGARVSMLHTMVGLNITLFLQEVIGKVLLTTLSTSIIIYPLSYCIGYSVVGLICFVGISICITIPIVLYIGCIQREREAIIHNISTQIGKLIKK